jgi:hypothetical protein
MAAALLTTGRRTVTDRLRTAGPLAQGHKVSYQRVLSAASWSSMHLACPLTGFVLHHLVPDGLATRISDDPVDGHLDRPCGYQSGQGPVSVRWVFVHDLAGTYRDE